jgi:hypothetical protein
MLPIENVPVVSCQECGDSYLTADTLHELESIRTHARPAESRTVAVVRFDAA